MEKEEAKPCPGKEYRGCKHLAVATHGCPYAWEIHGVDDDKYCTCCEDCEYECAQDI